MKIDPLAIVIGMAAAWYLLKRQETADADTMPVDEPIEFPELPPIVAPPPLGPASDFLDEFTDAASDLIEELGT